MQQVPIGELKGNHAKLLAGAKAGERIEITRDGLVLAEFAIADLPHLHFGVRFGETDFCLPLDRSTGGRGLEILLEDRDSSGPPLSRSRRRRRK